MNEEQAENLSHRFIDGKRTKKELEKKGLIREIKRRMIKIDDKTFVESPETLQPEQEEAFILKKREQMKFKLINNNKNKLIKNDKLKTEYLGDF
jgi:hypothetical protein